ncbi:guanylate kinase [Rickettsiella massiliensis]|uniref:guanylate kinase n=1 Tax=Rickettsiella massiliensis TaxID=676517 RepID=UPI000299D499|nr:guanylate kinase [Rickettsiella massiliensis]
MNIPGTLYIISAPSGGGKTSLVNALLESVSNLEISISYTTRPPRPGEKNGVDYYFVDPTSFDQLVAQHVFLEHALVFNHHYGTSLAWVLEKLQAGIDIILEIDWQGAQQIRKKIPQAVSIFILPPSWETLEKRLRLRAQDDERVIERRMAEARAELIHYDEYDYLVLNDNFASALADLNAILRVRRLRSDVQKREHALLLNTLLNKPF